MSTREQRLRLVEHYRQCDAIAEDWRHRGFSYPPPRFPRLAVDLAGLTCGAKTRAGTPCKQTALGVGGRCKWHGGCSTGPKTDAGKEQARINGRKGGRPKKQNPSHTPG
ncbi:HGGxSTG domain-containing protein [Quatrionicoccus australiensis]|uniref:HGGxSTG domain-containing protein n=1 Tax=Quatrionicoccus australiensis TaxID=138118 RepID=UPI00384CCACB